MKHILQIYLFGILLLLLIFYGCSSIKIHGIINEDSDTDWNFAGGNTERQNISKSKEIINLPLELLWKFDTESGFPSFSFCIKDAIVFCSTLKGDVYAIDIGSGNNLGRFSTPGRTSTVCQVLYQNSIIAAFSGNENISLIRYDINKGSILWQKFTGQITIPPLILDNKLIIASENKITCINADNGINIWLVHNITKKSSSRIAGLALTGKTLYVLNSDGFLTALDFESGKLRWDISFPVTINSSISIYDSLIYFGNDNKEIFCVNTDGKLKWKKQLNTKIIASSTFYNDVVIAGGIDGYVYSLNKETGKLIWKYKTGGCIVSSPLLHNGKIFIGSFDKKLYCLNANTGDLLWTYETEGRIRTSPLIWKNYLLLGSDDKTIYCFKN